MNQKVLIPKFYKEVQLSFKGGISMSLRINTNVQSLRAQNTLRKITEDQGNALERLSSGKRINRSKDDAAGLSISGKLIAEIRGSQQAVRNANDGISMVQVAESGMNEISNIVVRMRELSVQAASDTIGDTERKFTDLEFQELVNEVNRISGSTSFNGKSLLVGEGDLVDIQVGVQNNKDLDRIGFDPSRTSVTSESLGVTGLDVSTKVNAQDNLEKIDNALDTLNANRSVLGALQSRLASTTKNLSTKIENLSQANSRIIDTDYSKATADLTKSNILAQSNISVLSQANSRATHVLRLLG